MKVILNKDLAPLGEEGDTRDVAKGYARNYLFPRGIALPYTEKTIKLFEARRDEIEARKALKREDAAGFKERLEALSITLSMPAGANGKLYGAVTSQTVMEELAKQGFQIERKKIEIPGNTIKSVGRYKVTIKLYENAQAECPVNVEGQALRAETPSASASRTRRRRDEAEIPAAATETAETPAAEVPAVSNAEISAAENSALEQAGNAGEIPAGDERAE